MESNNMVVAFFESVKKLFPLNENGEIDASKVDYNLLKNNSNTPAGQYLTKKLAEFYVRGCTELDNFYKITNILDSSEYKKVDEHFFAKLMKNDFSDLNEFEKLYPYIQKIANYLVPKLYTLDKDINDKLWRENLVIPDIVAEYPQYREVYNQIVNDNGEFLYQESFSRSEAIKIILRDAPAEDVDLLKYAYRITRAWEVAYLYDNAYDDAFDERTINNLERMISSRNESLKRMTENLKENQRELKEIDRKMSWYNIITRLFKKEEKRKLIAKKEAIIKEIAWQEKNIDQIKNEIKEFEEKRKIIKNYVVKYTEVLREELLPNIKKDIAQSLSKEEQDTIFKLLDNIFNPASKRNANKLDALLYSFVDGYSYNDHFQKLNNALITIGEMASVIVDFEKQDDKSLFTFLDASRKSLIQVPTDSDHKELNNSYRKHNISGENEFMDSTAHYRDIPKYMNNLNEIFQKLMTEEDITEYIKKVGIIWYNFVLIHPYTDGNGRTGRYLLNMLLAHRGIIIPALYNSNDEQYKFSNAMDELILRRVHCDYDKLGELFLNKIREIGLDLTGENRLEKDKEETLTKDNEKNSHTR